MNKKVTHLGNKYWSDTVINSITANDFDFKKEVKKTVLKKEPLCECRKYGTKIIFEYEGQLYSFDFLTGYPCECEC